VPRSPTVLALTRNTGGFFHGEFPAGLIREVSASGGAGRRRAESGPRRRRHSGVPSPTALPDRLGPRRRGRGRVPCRRAALSRSSPGRGKARRPGQPLPGRLRRPQCAAGQPGRGAGRRRTPDRPRPHPDRLRRSGGPAGLPGTSRGLPEHHGRAPPGRRRRPLLRRADVLEGQRCGRGTDAARDAGPPHRRCHRDGRQRDGADRGAGSRGGLGAGRRRSDRFRRRGRGVVHRSQPVERRPAGR